jgi:hypothetical protein
MKTDLKERKILSQVILLAFIIRLVLLLIFQQDWNYMTPDEERNYEIATNFLAGRGYTVWDEAPKAWLSTSFHSSFNVFLYMGLQLLHIPKIVWVIFVQLGCAILYVVSAIYLFEIAKKVLLPRYALWAAILYLFFPSTVYFVGAVFAYENITVPLLIIILWQIMEAQKKSFKKVYLVSIPLLVTFSILLRPNMMMIYIILLGYSLFSSLHKHNKRLRAVLITTFFVSVLAHIPILIKNHQQFGSYILSTQTGYELLQGHNPTARGSWRGNWMKPGDPLYEYVLKKIPDIESLNEYEEGVARKKLAIQWIKENPAQDLILEIRKAAIYFLPFNFEVMKGFDIPNPINAIVYLLFITGVIIVIIQRKWNNNWMLIFTPFIGSIIITLVFFVGYRWRFYAEPFMCIFALYPIQLYFQKKRLAKEVNWTT